MNKEAADEESNITVVAEKFELEEISISKIETTIEELEAYAIVK